MIACARELGLVPEPYARAFRSTSSTGVMAGSGWFMADLTGAGNEAGPAQYRNPLAAPNAEPR